MFPVLSYFADDLNSLRPEDSRARSPSPPPLQPYDECPPLSDTPHSLAFSPTYHFQTLGPPPLTLMEDDSSSTDWHLNQISQPYQSKISQSPPRLNDMKLPTDLPVSKSELAEIKRHNLATRALAYKEVRRPGLSKYLNYF